MKAIKTFTCEVTAFLLDEPAELGVPGRYNWVGIATAHIFDPKFRGSFETGDPNQRVIPQEAMRAIHGKGVSSTQEGAMGAAIGVLLSQIETE